MKFWPLAPLLFVFTTTCSYLAQADSISPDYSVSMAAEKTSFTRSESVTVRLTVTNVKSVPIHFPVAFPAFVLVHLTVLDSAGSIVPPDSRPVEHYRNVMQSAIIAPGGSLTISDIIDEHANASVEDIPLWIFGYHLGKGRYTIVAAPGLVPKGGEAYLDSLQSKPLVIEVH